MKISNEAVVSIRNSEIVKVLGMVPGMKKSWSQNRNKALIIKHQLMIEAVPCWRALGLSDGVASYYLGNGRLSCNTRPNITGHNDSGFNNNGTALAPVG